MQTSNDLLPPTDANHASRALLRDFRLWFLCVLFLAVGILSLNDTIIYTPDSARYLAWARSLAHFEGFKDATGPEPSRYVIHAPLYPVLLAPLARFFPYDVVAAKSLTVGFGLLTLILFFSWTAKKAGKVAALWGCFFLATNPLFIVYSTQVLSDVPFAASLIVFFLLGEKIATEGDERPWVVAGFLVTVCAGIFLREVGLVLMLSGTFFFVLRKEYQRALLVLLIPLLFYLLWFIRNEVIVAGVEDPQFTNTRMLFSHVFTLQGATLLDEFIARVGSNFESYKELLGGLALIPQHIDVRYSVVLRTHPSISLIEGILQYARYPLIIVTVVIVAYGLYRLIRESKSIVLLISFLLCYLLLVMLYPIHDARFLFPLLFLILHSSVIGCKHLATRFRYRPISPSASALAASVALFVLALPNLGWTYNFVSNNFAYRRSPIAFYETVRAKSIYPLELTKALSHAGRWIVDHTDASAIVLSRWKELALWLDGRKVVTLDPLAPLDDFDNLLRDYRVPYIVSVVHVHGLRDFEFHTEQSHRFRFESVYRVADGEVLRVHRRSRSMFNSGGASRRSLEKQTSEEYYEPAILGDVIRRKQEVRILFRRGLSLLEQGRYPEAEAVFLKVSALSGADQTASFYAAIAKEFSMQLGEAAKLFEQFRFITQAGVYLLYASHHQNLIEMLEAAGRESSASKKAHLYHSVSLSYWELGFRRQARGMLDRSLQADPTFFPSLIFGAYYALQEEDTLEAKSYFVRSRQVQPAHDLVRSLDTVFSHFDSLRHESLPAKRAAYYLQIGKAYASMGLSESAIDQTLKLLQEDPDHTEGLRFLAELYEEKRRYAPALNAVKRLLAVDPNDLDARTKLEQLLRRW
ncbi:MAG: tetratricopeptide repeat protein [Bacteroidota bacterium]